MAVITALTNNALGRLAEDFVLQAGVDASKIVWREGGANTAVSRLKTGKINRHKIFKIKRCSGGVISASLIFD